MGKLYIVIAFLLIQHESYGQQQPLLKLIAGTGSREWTQKSWKESMGNNEKRCIAGVSYQFSVDGKLIIVECKDGKKALKELPWSVRSDNENSKVINFDDKDYIVRSKVNATGQVITIRLRQIVEGKSVSEIIDLAYETE